MAVQGFGRSAYGKIRNERLVKQEVKQYEQSDRRDKQRKRKTEQYISQNTIWHKLIEMINNKWC